MAHREQANRDLSTLDCPALLFGSVPLGERSAGYSTLASLSGEPISAGAQFTGLLPRLKIRRSQWNLLELGRVSTGGDRARHTATTGLRFANACLKTFTPGCLVFDPTMSIAS